MTWELVSNWLSLQIGQLYYFFIVLLESQLTVLEEQSLKETPLPKTISPEEELKILRRKAQESCYAPPTSTSIIKKMLLKKPYSLECFRALQEKENLLTEAIRCGNGDAILAVVLFLQKTLKKKHFHAIVQSHSEAIAQYINYLLIRCQILEAMEFLTWVTIHFS